jgi:hypothetical protein
MAEYTAKKANRGGPESSLEEADKVKLNLFMFADFRESRGAVLICVGTVV